MDRLISEQYLIEHLKACFENGRLMYRPTLDEMLEMIKAIPSAEPKIVPIAEVTFDDDKLHEIVEEAVKNIEIEPKTGHWIEEDLFDGDVAYRCSECNELFWIESGTPKDYGYNFCPKCGKRLVEPQESEDKE